MDRHGLAESLLDGGADVADRPRLAIAEGLQHCAKDDRVAELLGRSATAGSANALGNAIEESQECPLLSRRRV